MKDPFNDERFLKFASSYLREAFPNPTRSGCPGDQELRRFVANPSKTNASLTEHLACCSPCYSRYAALLQEQKLRLRSGVFARLRYLCQAKPTRVAWESAIVILLCIGTLLVVFWHADQPTYSAFTLDLSSASEPRGVEDEPSPPEILIPQRPLDLKIRLPLGSREGSYLVSLQSGQRVLWSRKADARLINHVITLEARADFRSLDAGQYRIVLESGLVRLHCLVQITRP